MIDMNEKIGQLQGSLEKAPVPRRWSRFMMNTVRDQVKECVFYEDFLPILKKHAWALNEKAAKAVYEVIELLDYKPAGTAWQFMQYYIMDVMDHEPDNTETETLRKRFNRSLMRLHECGFLTIINLTAKDVGKGKRSVRIWMSPFASPKDVEKVKEWYLSGGEIGYSEEEPKTAEYVIDKCWEVKELAAKKREEERQRLIREKEEEKRQFLADHLQCPECKQLFSKDNVTCSKCTAEIGTGLEVILKAGKEIKYCPECGTEYDESTVIHERKRGTEMIRKTLGKAGTEQIKHCINQKCWHLEPVKLVPVEPVTTGEPG